MSIYADDRDYGYRLEPTETTDVFYEFLCPNSRQFVLTVANQGINYQVGRGLPPTYVGEEIFAIPGVWIRNRQADSLRFKSASSGNPAVVSIEAN